MNKQSLMLPILSLVVLLMAATPRSISAQGCIQPAADLTSWWKADGSVLDVRGRSNGTLRNGTTFAAGYNGQAFSFDGTDDTIALGNPLSLHGPVSLAEAMGFPPSLTIEAWIKKDGLPANGIENILAKWGFDASVDSYLFGVINDGGVVRAFGAIGDHATGDNGLQGGVIPLDQWTHVAMSYNSPDDVNKLYVNGVEVATRVRGGGIFVSTAKAYFGNEDSGASRYFKGLIDEPAFYSRALTPAEIQTIYNAGAAGRCKPSRLFSPIQKVTPTSMGLEDGLFGTSVAASEKTIIVGRPRGGMLFGNGRTGVVETYEKIDGNWVYQTGHARTNGDEGDEFGHSVAISGNTFVVGSPLWGFNNVGEANVYVRNNGAWVFSTTLQATDATANDQFGDSVAIDGNTIVVGAPKADQPGQADAGAIYVFTRSGNTWTQTQKLIPTGPALADDRLGDSVSIGGDVIAAGAPGDDGEIPNSGILYIYSRSGGTWSQQQKIFPNDNWSGGSFGFATATDGHRIAAGAPGDGTLAVNTGRVAVYSKDGAGVWNQLRAMSSAGANGAGNDFFGASVAIKGDTLVVGAPFNDASAGQDSGSVYIFRNINVNLLNSHQQVNPNDGQAGAAFGAGVALADNNTVIAGAPLQASQAGAVYSFAAPPKSPFDFDGDGRTDVSIFRPGAAAEWWILRSSDGGNFATQFGASTDTMTPGDFTGDGKTDIAFWRPSTGFWYVLRSDDFSFYSFPFGSNGDIPAPADFDGDRKADAAVFRPSAATWFISRSTGGTTITAFGSNGDHPVAADYDNDGKADLAIYRPSVSQWWLQRSSAGLFAAQFGATGDKALPGDFTGDGKTDVAFWRPSTGFWYVLRSEDSSFYSFPFGANGDVPVQGDYDGDGKTDAGVFRHSTWFISRSSGGTTITPFGAPGDRPIPNAYVP